ncbi:hypothetical protein [Blastococcus sp. CT_GayMR16]|uniref:hypothetical protein n=1 Tax=Blastococcus sp. CT_GayMR16 TaxID=2559607 RepID=UPI00107392E1|nr:hypothetical protein [Blastococcus sp. CT_GayMR16]TFV90375.1 hypothetical protein E4P38_02745 [Blastococcus sp. CT_GayMR16]
MTAVIESPKRQIAGTTAIRLIAAEVLADLDRLGVTPRTLTFELWRDEIPAGIQAWFGCYDDAQAYADHLGVGDRTNFNGDSDSTLLHMGRATWEAGCPTIAGLCLGVRLVCDRPASREEISQPPV